MAGPKKKSTKKTAPKTPIKSGFVVGAGVRVDDHLNGVIEAIHKGPTPYEVLCGSRLYRVAASQLAAR